MNPTLVFGVDLSQLELNLQKINKATQTFSDHLANSISKGIASIKNANESLKFKVDLKDIAQTKQKIKEIESKIKQAAKVKLNLDIKEAKEKLWNLKEEAVGLFGSFKMIQAPLSSAIDFDASMTELKKFVDFASQEEQRAFENFAKAKAMAIGESTADIIQVAVGGSQAGFSGVDLQKYTDMISQMKVAYGISAQAAAEIANTWQTNFNLNLDELKELGDVVNYLDNKMTNVAAKNVGEILRRSGGAGSLAGLKPKDLAAFAAVTDSLKISTEVAGSSLNSFYNALRTLKTKGKEQLQSIGVDFDEFNAMMQKDATKATQFLLNTLANLDSDTRAGFLDKLLGAGEDFSTIAKITGNIHLLNDALKMSNDSAAKNTMNKELEQKLSSAASAIDRFKASLEVFAINIGQIFLPIFNTVIDGINDIFSFINRIPMLSKILGVALGLFATTTAVITTFKIAKAAATLVVLQYKSALALMPMSCLKYIAGIKGCIASSASFSFSLATAKLNLALFLGALKAKALIIFSSALNFVSVAIRAVSVALMSNPIGLILGGIAIIAGLIIANWDRVKSWFNSFISWISQVFNEPLSKIKSLFTNIFNNLGLNLSSFINIAFAPFNAIYESLKASFEYLSNKISSITNIASKVKDFFGFGDNEQVPTQNTNGAIETIKTSQIQNQTSSNKVITDNKVININLNNTNATPQNVAKAIQNSSYSFDD